MPLGSFTIVFFGALLNSVLCIRLLVAFICYSNVKLANDGGYHGNKFIHSYGSSHVVPVFCLKQRHFRIQFTFLLGEKRKQWL